MALMVSLSACQCGKGSMSSGGKAGASGGTVCVPMPCGGSNDRSCYTSEADRDMGRLKDDLPPGGCCGTKSN